MIGQPVDAFWDDDNWTHFEYDGSWTQFEHGESIGEFGDEWQSLLELECFIALKLADHRTIWCDRDCDDWAREAAQLAREWGRVLETEYITIPEMRKMGYKLGSRYLPFEPHMINKAYIGNQVWYIEPQFGLKKERIWRTYDLD